ncbi:MAG: SAM-dependent methyltransferase, partial [Deltaproteobacteria bacterium]|nr:SAM-dependent methyltransferase [Deltaproteobacteria bacterium]
NVRAATDDRPYFFDFFRWRSLPSFVESYGHYWFQRLELGYVVLVISLVQIVAAAIGLLLLPLFIWSRKESTPVSLALLYFLLIGFAFLALEMSLMQRFTLLMGDPLIAVGAVLSGFLFFSGCGSLYSRRLMERPLKAITVSGLAIAILAPLVLFLSQSLLGFVATWDTAGRFFFALSLLAPLAFLMGWPFPAGMSLLEKSAPASLAWAWGINGFASVAAAPLTVLLAMSLGFRLVLALAVIAYFLAVVLGVRVWRPRKN